MKYRIILLWNSVSQSYRLDTCTFTCVSIIGLLTVLCGLEEVVCAILAIILSSAMLSLCYFCYAIFFYSTQSSHKYWVYIEAERTYTEDNSDNQTFS